MFETKKLTIEKIEQRRLERKPMKRKNRRRKITRHYCKKCGEPKHYICLEHHSVVVKKTIWRIISRPRYYARKIYFSFAVKLGLAENKKSAKLRQN